MIKLNTKAYISIETVWLVVGLRLVDSTRILGLSGNGLLGRLCNSSKTVFMWVSGKTTENSKRLGWQTWPRIQPGTSHQPVKRAEPRPLVECRNDMSSIIHSFTGLHKRIWIHYRMWVYIIRSVFSAFFIYFFYYRYKWKQRSVCMSYVSACVGVRAIKACFGFSQKYEI